MPTKGQYIELIRTINKLNQQHLGQITIEWGDPLDHIFRFREIYKNLCTFVSIKADGSIVPSPYIPLSVGNINKHKLTEYWAHGLPGAWSIPKVNELAGNILCINDMGARHDGVPNTWFEEDIKLDIIEDNLFGNIDKS